ncbi:HAMP domain-containing sensor histidine kinase [Candidatus Kapabacteria bacterium]|nr:HAMP domain-containing sensor histidine kinase [Candidatus Kapabacteria bacterium]
MSDNHLIFNKEQEILNRADEVLAKDLEKLPEGEIIAHFSELRDNYEHLLKQQIKLTRLADSSQGKLRKFQVELDETNTKINLQNDELTKLNQTKDKFFSIVSHDIRNPLTAIVLMGEILKSNFEKLSPEQLNKQISKISDSIKLLYELFENLHRWSKAQSGILDFNPEEFNLLLVINNVIKLLEGHAGNKNIELKSDVEPGDIIFADKNMVETIIRNLVNNSVKFTKPGGFVKIEHYFDENLNKDVIKVMDNGIGMSQSIIDKLFKLGESSVKKKGTAQEPGSGLGLILCKEFVDKHSGEIWVESEIDKGTTFYFTIPPNKN